jgi:hypothetical protein
MLGVELFLLFVRPLNRAKLRYVIGGSVAAIFYGEPRMTNDLDVMVFFRDEDLEQLPRLFPQPEFYVPPMEVMRGEVQRPGHGQFNLIHNKTSFKADVFPTGRDEFNAWAFRHQRVVQFDGEDFVLAPPEYVIVRKLEYFREGGSDKHLRDIRGMLAVSGAQIDRAELEVWIRRQQVEAQWAQVSA